MSVLTPFIALILPFIVWPLELFLPYPAVVEELAKAACIFFLNRKMTPFNPLLTGVSVGLMFALSESVLYLFNIAAIGSIATLLVRLVLTIPMHAATSYVIALTVFKGRWRAVYGILGAIILHACYNLLVH
jgi:RsiW-degrading membrane proteinase PrsW (M82 family)